MKKISKLICLSLLFVYLLPIAALAEEHEHTMVEDFKAPTCSEEGYYNYYCSICKYSPEGVQILPKTDHHVESWISDKPAFCTSYGKEHGTCTECGIIVNRIIPPNGKHIPKTAYAYPSTTCSDGEILVKCALCNQTLEKTVIYRIKKISLECGCYEFNNKQHKPKVSALDRKNNEISAENIKVKYDKNSKAVGTHLVRIEFINCYDAEEVLSYRIVPKRTSIKSLKAKKNAVNIKVAKPGEEAQGYQISYSTDKGFKSSKTITVNSKKKLDKKITKLKSKKKYFFRVRTFSKVNDKKYYSKWSPLKSLTTK